MPLCVMWIRLIILINYLNLLTYDIAASYMLTSLVFTFLTEVELLNCLTFCKFRIALLIFAFVAPVEKEDEKHEGVGFTFSKDDLEKVDVFHPNLNSA